MFLSIIIPAYNASRTILPLLRSISFSKKVDFSEIEVIVVDDKSTDETVKKVVSCLPAGKAGQLFTLSGEKRQTARLGVEGSEVSLKTVKLKRNSGPAFARNIGAKKAKGRVILFLDADVLVYKNTLYEVVRSFKDDPDLFALTGVWDKKQKTNKFFPKFKALRDWSYWINERDPRNYYYLFSTRVAAIDKKLFLRLGGFNTSYKTALVEDIELTYRIARKYAVVFNPKVKVHHEFEGFSPIAKKYFWRSYYWSRIYRERKKFDPVATTGKEAMTTISAGGLIFFIFLSYLSYLSDLNRIALIATGVMLITHLFGVRKFLWFVFKEEGLFFAIRSFFTGFLLYLIILLGAIFSYLTDLKAWRLSKRDGG